MDEIEVVVKIPEDVYRYAKKYNGSSMLTLREEEMGMCMNAIANGIPLSKGHGRLTDMDEAIKCIEELADSREKQYALYLIDWACSKRVLIETDKE